MTAAAIPSNLSLKIKENLSWKSQIH